MSLGHWLPSLLVIAYAVLRCCAERFPSRNGLVAVPPTEVTKPPNYLPSHTRHGHQETLNVIDTVLLASVDGRFHAINRTTGQQLWSMASTPGLNDILPPLVRTEHDLDRDDDDDDEPQEVYIIEPQTGDIFILNQDATRETPLRKLPYSVSQLVELSPFSFNDPSDPNDPPRTFVGKKETSIITLDLTTGAILGTTTHILEKCRKGGHGDVDDYPETDDDFEDATPHQTKPVEVQIGRTDYQINVMSKTSVLQSLTFTVYGPNNVDRDRQMNWDHPPDDVYIQPGWEGTTYAFEARREAPLWISRFPEPVVAVFDVVTSSSNANAETHPVLLLQPRPRLEDLFPTKYQKLTGIEDRTVVGRVGNSLFAMGNVNFPLVNIAQLPNALLSIDSEKDKGEPNTLSTTTRCRDLFCFLGVRLTKRDDASSRLSRLLDSPEHSHFNAMDKRDEGPRGEDAQERIGGSLTASKIEAYPTYPPSPSRKLPSEPAPSSLNASASVVAEQPQFPQLPPTDATAHNWTLLIPFIGGFIAVWLLLRKFIRISDHVPKRFRERGLIQPLQRGDPRAQLLPPPPSPQDASGVVVESEPKELPVPPAYSVHAEPGQPIASSSRVRIEDLPILSEKFEVIEEVRMQDVSGPRAAAPTTVPAEEGGEDEEEDEEDVKNGGKRKKVRRKRGKKKNPQPANNLNSSRPVDGIADDYVQVTRPPAPTAPITSEPSRIANMSLPMPVTHTPASLVVTSNILGWGSHGTIVFEGSLQGRAVAVKRLQQEFVTVASREVAILQESDDHPHVIRYFYQERKHNFLYIALELCPASLADIVERPGAFKEIQAAFDPKRALQQITSGLKHLHSLKIVHRDIKPQNILVSKAQRNGGHRMMISDFGLCKKLELDQTSFLPTTVMGGSVGWRAPEILRGDVKLDEAAVAEGGSGSGSSNPPTIGPSNTGSNPGGTRLTKSVDIFALGCLFYYTLTSGDHPFGDKFEREVNILKGAMSFDGLEGMGEEGQEAVNLIRRMLAQEPQDRPDTSACLLHPFFWTPGRRLMFLQDASDRFEIMERDPKERGLVALETNAIKVIGPDWHKRLDRVFIDNLGKYRKYDGSSVQDLLRALRNKKHHYQDLPDNVKRHLGAVPEGFLGYFTRRFPGLFLHVHSTISNLPLRHEAMFRTYFQLEDS